MKVDVHREQYMSYKLDVASSNTQKMILHHVSGSTEPSPKAIVPDSYDGFCDGAYTPWVQIDSALKLTAPAGTSYDEPHLFEDDAEDDQSEDILEAEGESETSAGEFSEGDDE